VILNGIGLRGALDGSLYAIHQHVEKFLNVHLLEDICRVSIPILECIAESFRVDILLLRFQESGEKELQLVEHVIVFIYCGSVWHLQNGVPEAANHEELLEKRVHIADTTEVLDADVTSG
jgi:hypothetical protein